MDVTRASILHFAILICNLINTVTTCTYIDGTTMAFIHDNGLCMPSGAFKWLIG